MTATKDDFYHVGLTDDEVRKSRTEHGVNLLTPPKRPSLWKLYLEKFEDPVVRVLLVAAFFHKGGVAKTTSLLNLAAGIARLHGKKVCIIDADPQANTTMAAFGEEMASLPQDVMLESVLQEIMQDRPLELKPLTWLDRVDVLPASLDLAATEVIMNTTPGREFLFREIIRGLEKKYDHILIDCPPSLGIITQNALMASDFVIIPTDGNYFAMKGIEKIHYIIGLLRRKLGAEVRILGYFMTKYNAGRKLDVDIRESLIETLGESVFETTIRNNVALGEAQYNARSIFDYAPSSNGARDYRSLTEEFLKRIRKMNK